MNRILVVCESLCGGVFVYLAQLYNGLCDYYDICLVYSISWGGGRRAATPVDFRARLDPRIRLIELKEFGDLRRPYTTIGRLRTIEAEFKPDIIHLHSSVAGALGRLAYKERENTVIYTPHGYAFVLVRGCGKAHLFYLAEKWLGKKNALTLVCTPSEERIAKKLTKRTECIASGVNIRRLDALLGDEDVRRPAVEPGEERTEAYGRRSVVDSGEVRSEACGRGSVVDSVEERASRRFTVCMLGRISRQKQPEVFDRIARLVPEADFVWIGDGNRRDVLTAPNIRITGWMSRRKALGIARRADAFILCSLGEAVAMSLLENMYLGNLCLVSDTMGNQDVIRDGVNGYICHSPEEYAARIKEAMASFPEGLVRQAEEDVRRVYNTDAMMKKYREFYDRCLAEKGRSADSRACGE